MQTGLPFRDVASEADRQAVRDLLRSGFEVRPGLGSAFVRLYDALLDGDPDLCSRVAGAPGHVVGHALLAPRFFCVDGLAVPAGIVAMVVVAPAFRGRGIGSGLVRDVEEQARRRGLEMLHLAGALGYYRRFGYVEGYLRCCAEGEVAPGSGPDGGVLRPAGAAEVDALARLARQEVPPGAAAPTAARWRWVLKTGHPFGLLRVNEVHLGFRARRDFCLQMEGRAYVRAAGGDGVFAVYESASEDEETGSCLLAAVRAFAGKAGYRRLALHLPPENRLMRAAAGAGMAVRTEVGADLLVKVLDVAGLVARFGPLLASRFAASAASGWEGTVAFCVGAAEFSVACRGGRLEVHPGGGAWRWRISLPEIGLARALLGTDRLAGYAEGRAGVDPEVVSLLDVLFPKLGPFFWLADSL